MTREADLHPLIQPLRLYRRPTPENESTPGSGAAAITAD